MNKFVLLIDGNWLLMSRVSVMFDKFAKVLPQQDIVRSKEQLKDLICQSIYTILHKYNGLIDDIVFVKDGGSWRKHVERPDIIKDVDYKGTRTKDETIDFASIFGVLDELVDEMYDNGYNVAKECGVEGDDWIAAYTRYFFSQGISTLIWSTDRDLQQLIRASKDRQCFVAWTDGTKKIAVPTVYNDRNDIMEVLLNFDTKSILFDNLYQRAVEHHMDVQYIDGESVVTEKIICGDTSDNIKSVCILHRGGKNYGVSKNDYKKICGECGITTVDELFEKKDDVVRAIRGIKRLAGTDYTDTDIEECMEYNRKMVQLNEENLDNNIREIINKHIIIYKHKGIDEVMSDYHALTGGGGNKNIIEDLINSII